jgi:hypothetical protein
MYWLLTTMATRAATTMVLTMATTMATTMAVKICWSSLTRKIGGLSTAKETDK